MVAGMLKFRCMMDGDTERDVSDLFEFFGIYQIIQFSLICLPTIFVTMADVNYVFVAGDLEYR